MASTYKTPGVYIEEVSLFPPSVAQVETAIPAFVGYTQMAREKVDDDLINTPMRITSLLEYENFYGKAEPQGDITITILDQIDGSGNVLNRKMSGAVGTPSAHNMYYAMQAYFANGGGPCYIVSVGLMSTAGGTITASDLQDALPEVAKEDEVTLLVFPEATALSDSDYGGVMGAALNQCGELQDRFTILDVPFDGSETVFDAATDFRAISLPLDNLKYGAAYMPQVATIFDYIYEETGVTLAHTTVDPSGTTAAGGNDGATMDAIQASDGVLYNQLKVTVGQIPVVLPMSPIMAGIYAAVDSSRGVWKAPANVAISNVVKPTVKITNQQQEGLNVDTSGKSINAIRTFAGKGTLVWGARTLAGNDNEWRYVPVRRFFNMVEESVKKATEQFVFEPNDANTWTKVRAMIENFLVLQWRAGALAGATPDEAFFVSVGLGKTMTALDILEGRMIVEIGMAAVRPAEFIILRFSHKMQES